MAETRQREFPCAQCGAALGYTPGTRALTCDHCGHQQSIPEQDDGQSADQRVDYLDMLDTIGHEAVTESHQSVHCQSCAATFDFDPNVHADQCPFCGTRVVVDPQQLRAIRPWGLLPFKVDDDEADTAFRRWLKGLWFAPNALKRFARREHGLSGIYVPYWSYDCGTETEYRGQRGDAYQEPRRVSSVVNGRRVTRTIMQTRIRWRRVSGRVGNDFSDVLVYASNTLPRSIAHELEPWDLHNAVAYDEAWLSGYRSEIYSTDLKDGFAHARKRMSPVIAARIRRDIGGDMQRIDTVNTRYLGVKFRHLLLPFWVAGFRYRGKTYQFLVNGRTGEVQGDRPWSIWKITFAVVIALIIAMIAATVFGPLLMDAQFADYGYY
ncbi:primosomal protein N' (replication factor Y) - superfamily II helicase [Gammaproteobacteria bacterium]|nr:primosomal protein N' (replication factor Y) - superfamily II helicase [Gammaproteobacteria bacterium]